MKKIVFTVLVFLTFSLFAEDTSSLLSSNTFGLFNNALDGAFKVNENGTEPNFSSLTNPYIFGGLSNFNLQEVVTEDATPFILGFYNPGRIPSSCLLKIQVQTETDASITDGNISQETALVTVESESDITSEYNWVIEESSQDFSVTEAIDFTGNFQFIFHTGILNMGTILTFDYAKGDLEAPLVWAEKNRNVTTLYNYDKMEGTPPPQAALDYSVTETWEAPQMEMNLGIDVPFYIGLANSGHFFNLGFNYNIIDDSESHSLIYSEPASTGPSENYTEEESSSNDVLTGYNMDISYTITLPALIPTHKANYTEITPWFSYRINIADDMVSQTDTRVYATNMNLDTGSRKVLQSSVSTEVDSTLTLADSYTGGVAFREPLYFGLSNSAVLGISPEISLGYEHTPLVDPDDQIYKDYIVTNSEITTVKSDSDGDGVYEETIVTTVTSDSDGQGLAYIGSALFKLPMVIRISNEKWPFEFTLGSQIEVGTDLHWVIDNYDSATTVVKTLNSTGAVTNTTTAQETGVLGTTSERFWSEWDFTQTNKLGFTFRFPRYVTLDVILNSSNFFDFDNLTIQTIIALP